MNWTRLNIENYIISFWLTQIQVSLPNIQKRIPNKPLVKHVDFGFINIWMCMLLVEYVKSKPLLWILQQMFLYSYLQVKKKKQLKFKWIRIGTQTLAMFYRKKMQFYTKTSFPIVLRLTFKGC